MDLGENRIGNLGGMHLSQNMDFYHQLDVAIIGLKQNKIEGYVLDAIRRREQLMKEENICV